MQLDPAWMWAPWSSENEELLEGRSTVVLEFCNFTNWYMCVTHGITSIWELVHTRISFLLLLPSSPASGPWSGLYQLSLMLFFISIGGFSRKKIHAILNLHVSFPLA